MASRAQFIDWLVESGLLSQDDFARLECTLPAEFREADDARALARELIKRGVLTPYQATALYQGKPHGLVFANYVVLDKLGQGGMGMVFRAEHRRMKRQVALKVMAPKSMKSPDAVRRFRREVEAAARLTHPNIVAAFDADQAKGMHFLVMEYVEGRDLAGIVRRNGPLSVDQAMDCVIQAARGLGHAHAEGIIHRDIKPANLLLDNQGTVKILDMGLARIEDSLGGREAASLTQSGSIMGTVDYMSPEQALNTKSADRRADIYSLGCTLYYLLTRRSVFAGETLMAKLMAHREQPIPSLREARPDVSPELDAVFARMVAKDVSHRYQSMDEVAADLQAIAAGQPQAVAASLAQIGVSAIRGPLDEQNVAVREFLDAIAVDIAGAAPPAAAETLRGRDSLATEVAPPRTLPPRFTTLPRRVQVAAAAAIAVFLLAVLVVSFRSDDTTVAPQPASSAAVAAVPPLLEAPFDAGRAAQAQAQWAGHLTTPVELSNSLGIRLRLIPPGAFDMGSDEAEISRLLADDMDRIPPYFSTTRPQIHRRAEGPRHRVSLTRPIYMGLLEISRGTFARFVDSTRYVTEREKSAKNVREQGQTNQWNTLTWREPGYVQTDADPVVAVTWNDAVEFCRWLSNLEGRRYRLPTEAEWEYACRAGTAGRHYFAEETSARGDSGNYADQSLLRIFVRSPPDWKDSYAVEWDDGSVQTVAGGTFRPNPFGLHDLYGNVWEWCLDRYAADYYSRSPGVDPRGPDDGTERVMRGGGYFESTSIGRSGFRNAEPPDHVNVHIGFRIVGEIDPALPWEPSPSKDPPAGQAPPPATFPTEPERAIASQRQWARHLAIPVVRSNSVGMPLALIPPGEFEMGSNSSEIDRLRAASDARDWKNAFGTEAPRHRVKITRPFRMAITETTAAQFSRFVEATGYATEAEQSGRGSHGISRMRQGPQAEWNWRKPGFLQTIHHPVIDVTRADALAFCEWLSKTEGLTYRLPSEAEWEYACRAGQASLFITGDQVAGLEDHAWIGSNSQQTTHPVGLKRRNAFGLFDTLGNVWEWCREPWSPDFYSQSPAIDPLFEGASGSGLLRGGSFYDRPEIVRAATRFSRPVNTSVDNFGFRVVCEVDPAAPDSNGDAAMKVATTTVHSAPDAATISAPAANEPPGARGRIDEWILSLGGSLAIADPADGHWITITSREALPNQPLPILRAHFAGRSGVKSADLERLAGLPELLDVSLAGTAVDSTIVPVLQTLPALQTLRITVSPIRTSALQGLGTLHLLELGARQIDDQWEFVGRLPALRRLAVMGTDVPAIERLAEFGQLRFVHFRALSAIDSSIVNQIQSRNPLCRVIVGRAESARSLGRDLVRESIPRLLEAGVQLLGHPVGNYSFSQVTPAMVAQETPVLIEKIIIPAGTTLDEKGWEDLLAATGILAMFEAKGAVQADRYAATLSQSTNLWQMNFSDSDLSDAGLRALQNCRGLRELHVPQTRVTRAALEALRIEMPLVGVHGDEGFLPPRGQAAGPIRNAEPAARTDVSGR